MRSLWQRFIQSIFGKSDPLQGEWLGWQECDVDCDSDCELCDDYDMFEE
jgi:mRNA-degrading endonuclease YafQ of YafQ-DinJ toxin-antitoxin module